VAMDMEAGIFFTFYGLNIINKKKLPHLQVAPLANPAAVLAWNSDKRYLEKLGRQGVAIPQTSWTDRVTQGQLDAVFAATGAEPSRRADSDGCGASPG